jgi:hypothetical protein
MQTTMLMEERDPTWITIEYGGGMWKTGSFLFRVKRTWYKPTTDTMRKQINDPLPIHVYAMSTFLK